VVPDAESLLAHASGIRSLLRGLLADDARIDDVLQDTWVAALAKGPRPGVPLGPWLRRVARNFALKLRRGDARRLSRERAAARPDATPETRFDLQREAVDELSKLDEPYRSTLILCFFEGLSPKEIAERRGMPAATVRSHLKRGLDKIRERLDRSHGSRGAWGAVLLPWLATGDAAAATGVIVMGAKTKLLLAAAALVVAAGTVGWLAWHDRPDSTETARAAPARVAPTPTGAYADEAVRADRPALAEPERSIVLCGRIIDAETKRVVPGAAVRIRLAGEDGTVDLLTDAAGRFSGTSPTLTEAKLGPPATRLTSCGLSVAVDGYGMRKASPGPSSARSDELDFGDIEVERGAPVSGRVVRRDGSGIAGAPLLLSLETFFPPRFAFAAGRSGDRGAFVLDELAAPMDVERPWTLLAICDEGMGWQSVEVLRGRERLEGVEVVVDPAAPLEVLVTDTKGTPLEASVRAEPRFRPLHPSPEWSAHDHNLWTGTRADVNAILTAQTDAHGRAVFARLPMPGPYDIVAGAEGYALGWQDNVAVDREERRAATLKLKPKRLCAVSGVVLAEDGAPIAGATVGPRGLPKVTTDATGRFRFDGLEPAWGKVPLLAEAPGYAERSQDIHVAADRDVLGIEIRLDRAVPVDGRVVDQDKRPVAGVYLDLRRLCEQLRPDVEKTGVDGRFLFKGATKGPWKLRVIAPPAEPEWERYKEIEVRGGDTGLEVVLRRLRLGTTRLAARVVDAATGKPLDPANTMLMRLDHRSPTEYANPSGPERQSGEIAAERLHPDAWRLWVHVPGYAPSRADFTVSAGQPEARVEVRMGPAGRIAGRVVGGATGGTVWTLPAGSDLAPGTEYETSGRIRGFGKVAADGTFVVENLAPGATRLTLDARGLFGEATVDVPSGGEAHAEIVATPAAVLAFRSKDPVPAGTDIEYHVAQGGEWKCVARLGCVAGARLNEDATLPQGRTRWRVVLESAGRVRTQEGAVDLVVGQTAEVLVPIELER
jgi:RNA polymerase sigma-70 factor (ECF subfamily)